MKIRSLIGGALLAAVAATASAASMDLSRDIVARGAKPDWSLTVAKGTEFTLTRPGKPALKAVAPGASIAPGGANWSAKTTDGQPMMVALQSKTCTQGEKSYPMTAQVKVGAETLSGCAAPKP